MAWAAGLVVLVASTAGCGSGVESLHYTARVVPPEPTTTTTIPLDLSGATEGKVAGVTTTTAPQIGPGAARITGTVMGPGGPVANATVQAERFVNGATATTQATTGADGSFTIDNIFGGIWRVRAWQSPSLDLTTPEIFFLGTSEDHVLDMTLASFGDVQVLSAVAPTTVLVGQVANLEVQVTERAVDSSGVVRAIGQGGRSVVVTPGSWTLVSASPATTDGNGRVLFQLMCTQAGPGTFTVALADGSGTGSANADCLAPSSSPPATNPPGPGGSPATTAPGGPGPPTTVFPPPVP